MTAIVRALQSSCITRLSATRKEVQEKAKHLFTTLSDLSKLLEDVPHYRPYHAALNETSDPCVPWIGKNSLPVNDDGLSNGATSRTSS